MGLTRRASIAGVLALGGILGCGGPGFDPDVPPVTEGDWYRPAADVTWQWQLTGTPNTSYDVEIYDLDLFETLAASARWYDILRYWRDLAPRFDIEAEYRASLRSFDERDNVPIDRRA